MTTRLWLALVHYPVLNRERSIVATAVTNLDLHDIARAARTYGARGYLVVTPIERQRELVGRIASHWIEGHGAERVPERADAMSLLSTVPSLDDAIAAVRASTGERPRVVATCARPGRATETFGALRASLEEGRPVLLVFGTGWGLADEVLAGADSVLEPIVAPGSDYNHLSVRCAAAIALDRLVGARFPSTIG